MEQVPFIVTADQARVYDLKLGEARILVDGERSGGRWWMGQFREDPGFMTPLHAHPRMDEQLFVLDGTLSLYVCGSWHDLQVGSLAVVPRGTAHAQGNRGRHPVLILGAGNPAGFERFFAVQQAILRRVHPADPQFAVETARSLGDHETLVLGPPP